MQSRGQDYREMRSSSCVSTIASAKKRDPCVAKMSIWSGSSRMMGLKMFIKDRFVVVVSMLITLTISVLRTRSVGCRIH